MNIQEVKKRIEEIFKNAEFTDYGFNGEDEVSVVTFDQDQAIREVVELIDELRPDLSARLVDPRPAPIKHPDRL